MVRPEQAEMAVSALCLHAPRLPQHPLDARLLGEHKTRSATAGPVVLPNDEHIVDGQQFAYLAALGSGMSPVSIFGCP